MKFLPDTDTCIYALKQNPAVLKHPLAQSREDFAVGVITEAEFRTGAAKSTLGAKTLRLIENFLRSLGVVEFTSSDAVSYAQLRAKLEPADTAIGPLDTQVAAQAVAGKLVLVSNNEGEFSRVAGLRLKNWSSQRCSSSSTFACGSRGQLSRTRAKEAADDGFAIGFL